MMECFLFALVQTQRDWCKLLQRQLQANPKLSNGSHNIKGEKGFVSLMAKDLNPVGADTHISLAFSITDVIHRPT